MMTFLALAHMYATPLQFLETKTGAPLVVLHPAPVKMLLLSPPCLKTKTGAPFVVFDLPPRTTTVNKNTGILLFPFSYTSHFHLLLKHKILAKLLPRLLRGLHRFSRLAFKLEDSIVGGGTYSLKSCTPLQFLETKTGAPLVVLHPPPLSKCCCCLHLS